jgi:hypothetical protein
LNHRRPNPDELTPEDLFRPEPAAPAASAEEAATQYLPPYPATPPQVPAGTGFEDEGTRQLPAVAAGQAPTQAAQRPFFGFDRQPQPPYQAQQPPYPPGPGQPYGGPPQPQPQPGYDYAGGGGGRRFSNKAIAIGVVAACAVAGILAGALLSGGGGAKADAASASASAGASASGAATGGDAKAQATALYGLLSTAADSRSEAVTAVADISGCRDLDGAVAALKDSAGKHGQLVSKLAALAVDKLTSGQALDQALQQSWQASQSADEHYAAWGEASKGSCGKKHHPLKKNGALTAADQASSEATTAKQQAAQLWNAVASQYGLPQRGAGEL